MNDTDSLGRPPSRARRWLGRGARALGWLALGVCSLLLALLLTPRVEVSVFGQDVEVGAVSPASSLDWAGPGQADLFGEGPIDTVQSFQGPIRPLLVWQRFRADAAASAFITTTEEDGRRTVVTRTAEIGTALARAWSVYFVRLVVVAGILGVVLSLMASTLVGLVRGEQWRLHRARHPIRPLLLSGLVAMGVTAAAAALTVQSAREQLAGVTTLADLTGTAPLNPPPAAGPVRTDVEVAVIGDSTAAGVGNTAYPEPSDADIACARSRDAYAEVLGSATGLAVENLACASATIASGLLAEQPRRPVTPPAQVSVLKSIASLRVVIVSIGANDIGWSDYLKYCYGLSRCDDQASQQLMRSRIDRFRLEYVQLLHQLAELPSRPEVIVTGYYDPFGVRFDCAALADPLAPLEPPPGYGFAADPEVGDQATTVGQKIEPLRSVLAELNTVLADGAEAFGFSSVTPSFAGHALCSPQPWVQGMSEEYPFHPNAAGELAIAAALLPTLISVLPS